MAKTNNGDTTTNQLQSISFVIFKNKRAKNNKTIKNAASFIISSFISIKPTKQQKNKQQG